MDKVVDKSNILPTNVKRLLTRNILCRISDVEECKPPTRIMQVKLVLLIGRIVKHFPQSGVVIRRSYLISAVIHLPYRHVAKFSNGPHFDGCFVRQRFRRFDGGTNYILGV